MFSGFKVYLQKFFSFSCASETFIQILKIFIVVFFRDFWQALCGCCMVRAQLGPTPLQPYGLQPARLLYLWDFPGMTISVSCHFSLQGVFETQASNSSNSNLLCLLHCMWVL